MELLVSSMMPTRKGRLVAWFNWMTASGGRPSSRRPKFWRLRPVTKRPFLSVTVKMRLTSLTCTLMVGAASPWASGVPGWGVVWGMVWGCAEEVAGVWVSVWVGVWVAGGAPEIGGRGDGTWETGGGAVWAERDAVAKANRRGAALSAKVRWVRLISLTGSVTGMILLNSA